jgi:hypothetical protein
MGMRDFCPRCGKTYNWIETRHVGSRTYYYAVHVEGKRRSLCYLGPDSYEYVSMMHEGLSLRGMISDKREVEYIISLLSEIKERNIGEDEAIKLADFLEKTAKELRSKYKNDSTQ